MNFKNIELEDNQSYKKYSFYLEKEGISNDEPYYKYVSNYIRKSNIGCLDLRFTYQNKTINKINLIIDDDPEKSGFTWNKKNKLNFAVIDFEIGHENMSYDEALKVWKIVREPFIKTLNNSDIPKHFTRFIIEKLELMNDIKNYNTP